MKNIIEIDRLSYTYPDGKKALSEASIKIEEKEVIGILGPNGAGKTTLLLHINGIIGDLCDYGDRITIDGIRMNARTIKDIRKKIGFVFQNPEDQLFSPTVFEDLAFGLLNLDFEKTVIEEKIRATLQSISMPGYEAHFPHHLSFGERKKISLATVFCIEPKILILDEPTSNLDFRSRREIINLIKSKDSTKIIATHELNLAMELCGKIAILDEGKIYAYDDAIKIYQNKNLLQEHGLA